MTRSLVFKALGRFVWGLVVYSFGVYMTINGGIGTGPWEALSIGISNHLHVTYGMVVTAINLTLVVFDWKMGERIGMGTILDAVLTGNFTDIWMRINPLGSNHGFVIGAAILLAGLFVMALGMYFAMGSGQGCGPKDALLLVVGKRLPKLPIGLVQILIFLCAFTGAFLLGGPVGIGTLITVALNGTALQIVFNLLHYEARDTVHMDIFECLKVLKG